MPDYRCPKHDKIFESSTDSRKPGALATETLPAHPRDGHPDCPLCIEAAKAPKSQGELQAEARARAAAAALRAAAAAAEARAAAEAADGFEAVPAGGRKIA
jgi:hypothetical protein